SVNLLLPLVAIGLAIAYPRLAMAWLGAVAMTGAYVLGLALVYSPGLIGDSMALARAVPPVLVVAGPGYAGLGSIAAVVTRVVSPEPRGEGRTATRHAADTSDKG